MAYFTEAELEAATKAVVDNVMAPLNLEGMEAMLVRNAMHGFVQRQVANALTAAAYARGVS